MKFTIEKPSQGQDPQLDLFDENLKQEKLGSDIRVHLEKNPPAAKADGNFRPRASFFAHVIFGLMQEGKLPGNLEKNGYDYKEISRKIGEELIRLGFSKESAANFEEVAKSHAQELEAGQKKGVPKPAGKGSAAKIERGGADFQLPVGDRDWDDEN